MWRFVLLSFCCVAWLCSAQILHPKPYDLQRADVSLDTTPKCLTCRHIVTQLRSTFTEATALSPTGIVHEFDPCFTAPPGLVQWCPDVNKKLQQCPRFQQSIFERSYSAVKLCESCSYDQPPLPSVLFCENQLYIPLSSPEDQCVSCMYFVSKVKEGENPCTQVTNQQCRDMQRSLAGCKAFQSFVTNPQAMPRQICQRCLAPLPDGTLEPPGISGHPYCQLATRSPLQSRDECSTCLNVIHNVRNFPGENACVHIKDVECATMQEILAKCIAYNRYIDQHHYPAIDLCRTCYDSSNPSAPVQLCPSQGRVGHQWATQMSTVPQVTLEHYVNMRKGKSSFLPPEPPAPFPTPFWLRVLPGIGRRLVPAHDPADSHGTLH